MSVRTAPVVDNFLSGSDLSATQYTFVKQSSTENTIEAAGAGEVAIGIVENKPASGEVAEVAVGGGTYITAAAAIAIGDPIKSDASGKGVTASTNNDYYIARAIEAAAADGDQIEVIIEKAYLGNA